MAKTAFIDTNVWMDWFDSTRPRHRVAISLFEALAIDGYRLFTCDTVVTTLAYLLRKAAGPQATADFLIKMLGKVEIVCADGADLIQLIRTYPKDVEDSVLETIAVKAGISYLLTNDLNGFGFSKSVLILTPADWLMERSGADHQ